MNTSELRCENFENVRVAISRAVSHCAMRIYGVVGI